MTIKLQQLLVACQEGHVKRVGEILDTGEVGVNAADELEITAIQVAAANNQDQVIDLLVAHGANVEATNNSGWSPVMQACYHGHTSTLNKLIKAGAKLHGRNRYGATPLNMAAAAGHLSTVRSLLEQGVPVEEDLPPQVASCPTPLMTAALHGRDAVLRTLLNRGAAADKAGTPGDWTPLMLAAAGGSKPSAQILIERGANPDKMNLLGGTALEIAMATGNSECRAYLEKRTKTPGRVVCEASLDLIGAARMGDKARVEELLGREDTDVDITDSEGATPLILAAIAGHLAITQLLIGLGANLNHQDRVNGWTALMQATFYCHGPVAAALLHAGADPTVTAHNGCTALDLATLVDDADCALIRQLATHTIRVAPPSLSLEPLMAKRSRSMMNVSSKEALGEDAKGEGFKSWWGRISGRFKKLNQEHGKRNQVNIVVTREDDQAENGNGLLYQSMVPQSSVFTLGFSSAEKSESLAALSPPSFSHTLHDTSVSPSKMGMPEGRKPLRPMHLNTNRFLAGSDSATNSPSNSTGISRRVKSKERVGRTRKQIKYRVRMSSEGEEVSPSAAVKHRKQKKSSNETTHTFLKKLGLENYYKLFAEQEIDRSALKELTDEDLEEIGVTSATDRSAIIQSINEK